MEGLNSSYPFAFIIPTPIPYTGTGLPAASRFLHLKVKIAAFLAVVFRRLAHIAQKLPLLYHFAYSRRYFLELPVDKFIIISRFRVSVVPVSSFTSIDSTIPFAAATTCPPVSAPMISAGLYLY